MVHGNLHLKDVHLDDMKTEILNSMTEHKVPLSEIN